MTDSVSEYVTVGDECGCCGREFGEGDLDTRTCGGCGAPLEVEP